MAHGQDDERAAAILGRRATGLLALDEALAELADANCVTTIAVMIVPRPRASHCSFRTAAWAIGMSE